MRSSPLICLADTISILIHFATTTIARSMTFTTSLEILIRERFDEDRESDNAIGKIQQLTWLRYLFFVIGTLPPAIKMIAMQGLPWTKTWAIMYLTSFLATEVLVLLSWKRPSSTDVHWFPVRFIYQNSPMFRFKNFLVAGVHELALFVHIQVAISAFLSLTLILCQKTNAPLYRPFLLGGGGSAAMLELVILAANVLFQTHLYELGVSVPFLGRAQIILLMIFIGIELPSHGWLSLNLTRWLHVLELVPEAPQLELLQEAPQLNNSDQMLFDGIIATSLLSYSLSFCILAWMVLLYTCRRFPGFGAQLMLTLPSDPRRRSITSEPDPFAIFWFVLFVYSLASTVLWYSYKYDPQGTVDPGWTGVFG